MSDIFKNRLANKNSSSYHSSNTICNKEQAIATSAVTFEQITEWKL